jgi:hypothetical protein
MITRNEELRRLKLRIAELERCIADADVQSMAAAGDRKRIRAMLADTLKAMRARRRLLERR